MKRGMAEFICYCFEYTESDIVNEVVKNHGRSLILEKIIEARKNGTCQCDTKNPRGPDVSMTSAV
jgi:hypothetical protein